MNQLKSDMRKSSVDQATLSKGLNSLRVYTQKINDELKVNQASWSMNDRQTYTSTLKRLNSIQDSINAAEKVNNSGSVPTMYVGDIVTDLDYAIKTFDNLDTNYGSITGSSTSKLTFGLMI